MLGLVPLLLKLNAAKPLMEDYATLLESRFEGCHFVENSKNAVIRSGSGAQLKGPFKEAIVFIIGGGNYVEYRSLMELGQRSQPVKHVIYGTLELLNGSEFVEQLTVLGQKMGLGNCDAVPSQ